MQKVFVAFASNLQGVKACQDLPSLSLPGVISVSVKLEVLEDLQLEVDATRRLRLAATAHTYRI